MAGKSSKRKAAARSAGRAVLRTRLRERQYIQRIKLAIIRRALADQQYREAVLSGGETLQSKALRASFKVPLRKGIKLKAVAETPKHLYLLVPHDVSDTWLPMALIGDPIIQVTSRAATDEEFRKRLVAHPKEALKKACGIAPPRGVKLEVLVDTARLRHVVIPVTGGAIPEVKTFKEAFQSPCFLSPNRTTGPCARNPDLTQIEFCPYPPQTKITDCSGVTTDTDCVTATTDGDCGHVTTTGCGTPSTASCESATTADDCDFFTLPCHEFFTVSQCSVESGTDDDCGVATDDSCGGGGLNSPTTECGEGNTPTTETGCTGTPDQPITDDQTPLFF